MKRIFLSLILGAAVLTARAQYQFPNSSFDGDFISSYGSYNEPEGWHGYASINAGFLTESGRDGNKLQQYTSVRSGATGKCVGIHSTNPIGSIIANGVLTNGQIYAHSTIATRGSENYNFSDPNNKGDSDYGANNQFYTPFTGRPDYVKVWVKFAPAKSGTGNARCSIILHKAGTVMYDPEDNVKDTSIVIARAQQAIEACDWTQLRVPFSYADSISAPGLILATFSTNETPGKGSENDYLYIDDIEMEYLSTMESLTYNGSAITFTNGIATVNDAYSKFLLDYKTTGIGAQGTSTYNQSTNKLTVTIMGNDVSVNPSNVHTYTIQFEKPSLSHLTKWIHNKEYSVVAIKDLVNMLLKK